MEKLNFAVIGTGNMGKNHVRLLNEIDNVNLVAISDANSEQLNKISSIYKVKQYIDYKNMLDSEKLDAVIIAVPTSMHKKVAFDVIEKGINILIEKPIASTVEDAQDIISKAREKNVKLMVGHVERFNPAVTELKKRIDNKELGKIYKFSVARSSPFPARILDVGVVIDLAVHDLDIISNINNSRITHIYAQTEKRIHSSNEDMLCSQLSFENGVIGLLNIDWLTPVVIRELSITGEKGMFKLNYLTQELYFYKNSASEDYDYSSSILSVTAGDMMKLNIQKQEPLRLELESFIDCIKENKDPKVTGDQGLLALELALKILESSRTKSVIKL
ncbi:MAG: Gfo/Idh/MocA family oxidoreductase [Candidatus Woesearchaeota archaeon]